jgi:hypothetical protein
MSRLPLDADDALTGPFYFLAMVLVVMPLLDFTQSITTFQPGNVQWRFATMGLASNFTLTPMLGIGLAIAIAAFRGQAALLRIFAWVTLVAAGVLILLLAGFILDVLQLRSEVPADGRAGFESASLRAVVKHVISVLALAFLGVRARRIPSAQPSSNPARHVPVTVIKS